MKLVDRCVKHRASGQKEMWHNEVLCVLGLLQFFYTYRSLRFGRRKNGWVGQKLIGVEEHSNGPCH